MLIDALTMQFRQQGYLHLEGFFSGLLMDKLQSKITHHYGVDPMFSHTAEFLEKASVEVIPWFPLNDDVKEFSVIASDRRLNALTTSILGTGWKELYCMVMYSKTGTTGQAWHQDCVSEDPTQFNINRLIYTESISTEIGGEVVVVPSSHNLGRLPVGEQHEDMQDQVVLRPKKGDLVVLHGHTWHRITPVLKGHRVSTNYRVIPKSTPENITDVCVYRNMLFDFSTNSVLEERL
ncbi:phytanoyl-CoA dioxygenase family protein [uncultured Vibrio sp.]|uniref:phytanoyl-CoA dioxygenase family protein n=1 Tax=uncultured Vibrio sp. TaxID=114054 RepID=UPI0025F28972|nr:phytanoyl-CoA dioxygenase family protein [uncultured Vibrio sp.]